MTRKLGHTWHSEVSWRRIVELWSVRNWDNNVYGRACMDVPIASFTYMNINYHTIYFNCKALMVWWRCTIIIPPVRFIQRLPQTNHKLVDLIGTKIIQPASMFETNQREEEGEIAVMGTNQWTVKSKACIRGSWQSFGWPRNSPMFLWWKN